MTSIDDGSVIIQTSESVPSTPFWFGGIALMAAYLRKHGVLTKISEHLRFARRRLGRYEVIDFLAVLAGLRYQQGTHPSVLTDRCQPAEALTLQIRDFFGGKFAHRSLLCSLKMCVFLVSLARCDPSL